MKETFKTMTEEKTIAEEADKPFIIIDGVQISVEDLPLEAQGIFSRLQRLTAKKAGLTLDLEEIQASVNFFSGSIVSIFNENNLATSDRTSGADKPSEKVYSQEEKVEKSNN
jgi:hypothetical protein|tara:strand:+ start:179 stop:514 length:336 start_codon:yes stop_codon:yes gene_type:complete